MTTTNKVLGGICILLIALASFGLYKEHIANIILDQQTKANNVVVKQKDDANKAIATQLATTLSQLEAAKKANDATPQTIVKYIHDNPTVTPGVTPTVVTQADVANETPAQAAMPDAPKVGDLIIPASETKAWFDAQIQCKEDQVSLQACTSTSVNDKAIIATQTKQIAEDHVALKGGTKWQRAWSTTWKIAAGLGAGYVAGKLQK